MTSDTQSSPASTHDSNRQLDMQAILNPQPGSATEPNQQFSLHVASSPSTSIPPRLPSHRYDAIPSDGESRQNGCDHPGTASAAIQYSESFNPMSRPPHSVAAGITASQESDVRKPQELAALPLATSIDGMVLRNLSSDTLSTSDPLASRSQGTTSPISPTFEPSLVSKPTPFSHSQPHLPLAHRASSRQLGWSCSDVTPLNELDAWGKIPYTLDISSGSAKAAEKRRKNSYASKRFRQRKKAGEAEQMCIFKKQEDELRQITRERDFYRAERDALRELAFKAGVSLPPRPPSPRTRQSDARPQPTHCEPEEISPLNQSDKQGSFVSDSNKTGQGDQAREGVEIASVQFPVGALQPRPSIGPSDHIPFRPFPNNNPVAHIGTRLPHMRDMQYSPP
ncbi:hypothetical protein KEM54_003158 [Ascosphaera aggregata]|nr:hypothetical protein KEM54_003158 [Ascosphaera aggregata]